MLKGMRAPFEDRDELTRSVCLQSWEQDCRIRREERAWVVLPQHLRPGPPFGPQVPGGRTEGVACVVPVLALDREQFFQQVFPWLLQ
jgi:hypothetical protein